MLDSILIVGGETARKFRFDIAIDRDYPMQSALNAFVRPIVLETPGGPPAAGRSGWLFHLDAKNVQILQILPLREPEPGEDEAASPEAESEGSLEPRLRISPAVAGDGRPAPADKTALLPQPDLRLPARFPRTAGLHPPHRRRHRLPGTDGPRNPRYRAAIRPNPTGGELMIVTIDGPAGSGKSTAARLLAERLGFQFLDTGAMYRAVALECLERQIHVADDDPRGRGGPEFATSTPWGRPSSPTSAT